jgi:hypothetical protein
MKRKILTEELATVLKRARKDQKLGKELLTAMNKIRKEEHLESNDFMKIYEILWKEGPKVQYKNPDRWSFESA